VKGVHGKTFGPGVVSFGLLLVEMVDYCFVLFA